MKLLEKIDLFLLEMEDILSEGRKPFFKSSSPEAIVKHVLDKYGDQKIAYRHLNKLRKNAVADGDSELAYHFSAALKLLGYEGKSNARGARSNAVAAAHEVHKNMKKVLGYNPTKKSGDFTEAEKKRIEQYVRTRYKNVDPTELHKVLSQLKSETHKEEDEYERAKRGMDHATRDWKK